MTFPSTLPSTETVPRLDHQITAIQAGSLINLTYTRDGSGNVKSVGGLPRPVLIPGTTDYAHTPGTNRLESSSGSVARSYAYDNAGNIVSDGILTFEYDQSNRLARVEIGGATVAEYAYDAFHRRVKKVVGGETTYFHYDADGLLICETDASGNAVRDYVYLNGEPIAMRVAGDWFWFINDHLGTPRIMVDASGAVVWKAAYLPFGRAIVAQADVENNLRFPGQYFDAETGLHFNWHRYYDPGTGRYLRADPIGLAGGINLYAYVSNDPLNLVDPDGRIPAIAVVPLVWGLIEAGLSAYDMYDTASTLTDPCSSLGEKSTAIGLYAMGVFLPGGGYGKIDDIASASKRVSKSAAEMAGDLANQIGKNSVKFRTPKKAGHIDLRGKLHFDKRTQTEISTPHVQTRDIRVGPNGQISAPRKTEITQPATRQDVRTARELARRQGFLP